MTHKITLDSACFPQHISVCLLINVIQTSVSSSPDTDVSAVKSSVLYRIIGVTHYTSVISSTIMTKGHVEFLNHKGKSNSKSIFLQILELLCLEVVLCFLLKATCSM